MSGKLTKGAGRDLQMHDLIVDFPTCLPSGVILAPGYLPDSVIAKTLTA
jgi:hypothetical protein